jgi:micrococcal nuclease
VAASLIVLLAAIAGISLGQLQQLARLISWIAVFTTTDSSHRAPLDDKYQWRTVIRIIDGDTILLDADERVRLIGIDTPESVDPRRPVQYFGEEASGFVRQLLSGHAVRLEYDQTRTDAYGRTLAYVYRDDGIFVNAEIIKRGFGFAFTRFPFRYSQEFRQYEQQARDAETGLWANPGSKP